MAQSDETREAQGPASEPAVKTILVFTVWILLFSPLLIGLLATVLTVLESLPLQP